MIIKLQGRLLAWERELDDRENALMARVNGVVATECVLGTACMECDDEHDHVKVVQ
jgi:hypothetical protein